MPSLLCGRRCQRNVGTMYCCELGLLQAIHIFWFFTTWRSLIYNVIIIKLYTYIFITYVNLNEWYETHPRSCGVDQAEPGKALDNSTHLGVWWECSDFVQCGSLTFWSFRSFSHRFLTETWPEVCTRKLWCPRQLCRLHRENWASRDHRAATATDREVHPEACAFLGGDVPWSFLVQEESLHPKIQSVTFLEFYILLGGFRAH